MAGSHEWLSALETFDMLNKIGLQGRDLVKVLARECGWNDLRSIGFRQVTIGDDQASDDDRNSLGASPLWRYFCAAFWDGVGFLGQRSTFLEEDWDYFQFKYRIERDADDDTPSHEIECWIDWRKGTASYSTLTADGSQDLQEVWRSIQFDRLGIEALARRWKLNGAANLISSTETSQWIEGVWRSSNIKNGWRAFRDEFGNRAGKKAEFEALWRECTGNRGRGALTKNPKSS